MNESLYQLRDVFNPQIFSLMDNLSLLSWMMTCRHGRDTVIDYVSRYENKVREYSTMLDGKTQGDDTFDTVDHGFKNGNQLHGKRTISRETTHHVKAPLSNNIYISRYHTQQLEITLSYFRGEVWGAFSINIFGDIPGYAIVPRKLLTAWPKIHESFAKFSGNWFLDEGTVNEIKKVKRLLQGRCSINIDVSRHGQQQMTQNCTVKYNRGVVVGINNKFNPPKNTRVIVKQFGKANTKVWYQGCAIAGEGQYVGIVKSGQFAKYFASGKKKILKNFRNDELCGPYKRWDETGKILIDISVEKIELLPDAAKIFETIRDVL